MEKIVLTVLLVSLLSCSDASVDPQPRSHELKWEVDTILPQAFQFVGKSLWGASRSKVYLGGHNSDGHQSLLQWNGNGWLAIDMWELGFNTITDIDGVDSNTVAVVGDGGVRGAIGLYRNGKWDTLSVPNLRPSMHSVDIVSAYEIYIASVDGILKIDGDTYKWIVDSSASKYLPGSGYPFNPGDVIKGVDGKIYYTEYSELPGNPPALKMFMIDDDGVVEKISVVEYPTNDNVRVGFYMNIVGDMLLSGQSSIYSLYAGVATHEHDVAGVRFTGDDPRRNLYSVGKKSIWHYNGVDWANVTPEEVASSARMFPIRDAYFVDDVLFVCVTHDGYKTLIYRGYQQ